VALRVLLAQPGIAAAVCRRGDVSAEGSDRLSVTQLPRRAQTPNDLQDDVIADVVEVTTVAAKTHADHTSDDG